MGAESETETVKIVVKHTWKSIQPLKPVPKTLKPVHILHYGPWIMKMPENTGGIALYRHFYWETRVQPFVVEYIGTDSGKLIESINQENQ